MSRKLLLVAAVALSTPALAQQQTPQPAPATPPAAGTAAPATPRAPTATQPGTTGDAATTAQPGAAGTGTGMGTGTGAGTGMTAQPGMGTTTPALPGAAGTAGTEGMQTLTTSTMALTFATMQPTDVVASRLIGANVYNKQNETVGEVEDMLIDNGKTVRAVILSVGGFLGLGERHVAVDPGSITLMRAGDGGTVRAVVDTTKEQLNNAPAFEYARRRP